MTTEAEFFFHYWHAREKELLAAISGPDLTPHARAVCDRSQYWFERHMEELKERLLKYAKHS